MAPKSLYMDVNCPSVRMSITLQELKKSEIYLVYMISSRLWMCVYYADIWSLIYSLYKLYKCKSSGHPQPFPPNYEVVRQAELTLQSILLGSEGVNVTPSPVRNAKHESKSGKAKLDCTYSTGTKGLNLQQRRENKTENFRLQIINSVIF